MAVVGNLARQYRFGRFTLEPARRCLSVDGAPVPLGSRAFDILQMLIERRDTVVSREDILAQVWRGTVVEGNTLAVQISALRRALGEPPVIATVAGRGYRFVGTLQDERQQVQEVAGGSLDHFLPPVAPAPPPVARSWPAVLLGLLAIVACLLFVGRNRVWPPHVAPRLSIVVLPFRNLGHDPEQDYLADAISDDLTTDLSHIPGSVVIARTSADSYKGRAVSTGEIGRALDVRYVLEGSLMAEGANLHINAQLIDAPTGAHLWARAFDVSRDKLGEARAEIVNNIGSALNVTLVDVESLRSLHDRPRSPDAVDMYLRARSVLDRSYTMSSLTEAGQLLEHAVAFDQNYSDALAELGRLLINKISDFDDPTELMDHQRATWAISRALQISPMSITAMTASGYLSWLNGQTEQAESSFRLILSQNGNEVGARMGLAKCAHLLGHMQEMVDDLIELSRIDPVGADLPLRQSMIGAGYLLLGRPKIAADWLHRAGAGLRHVGNVAGLDWMMWRDARLIAATQLAGDSVRAHSLYVAFSKSRPNISAWRLGSYETKVTANLPGHIAYIQAIEAAGMPAFSTEEPGNTGGRFPDVGVGSDFDVPPGSVPGATTVGTDVVRGLLSQDHAHRPIIVDVGRGVATIPGAVWTWADDPWADQEQALFRAATDAQQHVRPIIVMGTGPFGWTSYQAAEKLVIRSPGNVLWYRGGEEAWAASNLPSIDRRVP